MRVSAASLNTHDTRPASPTSLVMFAISVQVHSETIPFLPFAAGFLIFHNDDMLPLILVYREISQDSLSNQWIGHKPFPVFSLAGCDLLSRAGNARFKSRGIPRSCCTPCLKLRFGMKLALFTAAVDPLEVQTESADASLRRHCSESNSVGKWHIPLALDILQRYQPNVIYRPGPKSTPVNTSLSRN